MATKKKASKTKKKVVAKKAAAPKKVRRVKLKFTDGSLEIIGKYELNIPALLKRLVKEKITYLDQLECKWDGCGAPSKSEIYISGRSKEKSGWFAGRHDGFFMRRSTIGLKEIQ